MAATARMMATATRPQKRKATMGIDPTGPSPLPISKRTRYRADRETNEDDLWEGIVHERETSNVSDDYSTPASSAPSYAFFEEASVAETLATSTSRRPKKYVCDVPGCGKAFDRPARLEIHTRSHTNERPYVCDEETCGKTFTRLEHLTRHKKDKHSEAREHVCTHRFDTVEGGMCGKSFTTATRLRRHVAAHEAKEETTCSHPGCGKVFRKQETLQRHIKIDHLHEKPFKCEHVGVDDEGLEVECGQAFAKADGLKNHEAREHSGRRYFCEICTPEPDFAPYDAAVNGGERLEMPPTLEDAMVHPNTTFEEFSPNTELHAPLCPTNRVGFPTYTDLQLHLRTLHPPTCTFPDCGKICETNRALKAHLEIEHSALATRQTHPCTWPGCGRGFTKAGNLKVHMQSVHMKARNFVCGEFDLSDRMGGKGAVDGGAGLEGWNGVGCGRGFGTKANLEEHVRTQHLGLKGKIKPCRMRKAEEVKREAAEQGERVEGLEEVGRRVDDGALWKLTGCGHDGPRVGEDSPGAGEVLEMEDEGEEELRRGLMGMGVMGDGWEDIVIDPALQAV
ncbi:hypothetical protein B0A55_04344 [Friedmanniomyces simplex]|uniref:C2H2-type domain-containing protein n=1 Tax=Friedmanniomyces simplex TaxID=329884 RepID=A0A4U0XLW3_9PEZI|nr:hypothetical protein B0A55_04344 [Friedmanniomyces simplex]